MPAKKKERVKVGSVSLPLYPWRGAWRWSWKDATGKWCYGTRKDKAEAVEAARAQARSISNGALDLATLTGPEADLCRQFLALGPTAADLQKLREWKSASGIALAEVVALWFAQRLAEMHGAESPHLRIVRQWLEKFAAANPGPMSAISATQLRNYIETTHQNPKTRQHARVHVAGLWKFARKHSLTASTEDDKIPAYKNDPDQLIEIWTPEEMGIMLRRVPGEFLPWLVLSSFSGLRSEEIAPKLKPKSKWKIPGVPEYSKPPLRWSAVKRAQGYIDLPAATSKVRKRRLVPIPPLLESWLEHIGPPADGMICALLPAEKITGWLGEAVGGWKKNALRHSYGSYRAAQIKNLPALAIEMGNSVAIIENHYREAVSESQSEKYWSLTPSELFRNNQETP